VNLKSIKDPIKRNKTNIEFVPKNLLKIVEWNNVYHKVIEFLVLVESNNL